MNDHADQQTVIHFFASHTAAQKIHTLLIGQAVTEFRSAQMDYRTKGPESADIIHSSVTNRSGFPSEQ